MLKEKLNKLGVLGCVMCIVGSVVIVLHAPQERTISSVTEVWNLATQPAFLLYAASVIAIVLVLIFHFAPTWGHTHVMVFVGICSLMGSLSVWFLFPLYYMTLCTKSRKIRILIYETMKVMSVKALGIAIKLTFEGENQFTYWETWLFLMVVVTCIVTQMNYLNKVIKSHVNVLRVLAYPEKCWGILYLVCRHWIHSILQLFLPPIMWCSHLSQ